MNYNSLFEISVYTYSDGIIPAHVQCVHSIGGVDMHKYPFTVMLNDDMDNEWLDMKKNYKTSGRKMKDLQKPKEK